MWPYVEPSPVVIHSADFSKCFDHSLSWLFVIEILGLKKASILYSMSVHVASLTTSITVLVQETEFAMGTIFFCYCSYHRIIKAALCIITLIISWSFYSILSLTNSALLTADMTPFCTKKHAPKHSDLCWRMSNRQLVHCYPCYLLTAIKSN